MRNKRQEHHPPRLPAQHEMPEKQLAVPGKQGAIEIKQGNALGWSGRNRSRHGGSDLARSLPRSCGRGDGFMRRQRAWGPTPGIGVGKSRQEREEIEPPRRQVRQGNSIWVPLKSIPMPHPPESAVGLAWRTWRLGGENADFARHLPDSIALRRWVGAALRTP